MLKSRLFWGLIFMISAFAACEKPEAYDADAQFAIDEAKITKWADSTKTDLIKGEQGLYYQIIEAGTGTVAVEQTDTLSVQYEGRLLTDSVFSKTVAGSDYKFVLANMPPGWRIGLPLIKEGGKIRLLIPSILGYRNVAVDNVPANSVLNFTIDLKKVIKKVVKEK